MLWVDIYRFLVKKWLIKIPLVKPLTITYSCIILRFFTVSIIVSAAYQGLKASHTNYFSSSVCWILLIRYCKCVKGTDLLLNISSLKQIGHRLLNLQCHLAFLIFLNCFRLYPVFPTRERVWCPWEYHTLSFIVIACDLCLVHWNCMRKRIGWIWHKPQYLNYTKEKYIGMLIYSRSFYLDVL